MNEGGQYPKIPIKQHICLLDLDFSWSHQDIPKFIELWNAGLPINKIARKFRRQLDEAFILALDLARRGQITARPGGILGGKHGAVS